MNKRTYILSALVGVLVSVHLSTVLFGQLFWWLDILSHFQLQIFVAVCIITVVLWLVTKNKWLVGFCVVYALVVGVWVFVDTVWTEEVLVSTPPDIYYQNVLYGQSRDAYKAQGMHIAEYNASIIALVESHPTIVQELQEFDYTVVENYQQYNPLNCAILIKRDTYTVGNTEVVRSFDHDPLCVVYFDTFDLYVVHPLPPKNAIQFARQKKYFEVLRDHIERSEQEGRAWYVVGDFNSTRYSSLFRSYFDKYNYEQYYSWGWPSILTIPIDHVFSSDNVSVYLYPALSSDHRGLGVIFNN